MYSLYIGSLCNVAFPMARFTCIVTSQVFVEIWMRWSIALSSAFYTDRKHLWIVFSFKNCDLSALRLHLVAKSEPNCYVSMKWSFVNVFNFYQQLTLTNKIFKKVKILRRKIPEYTFVTEISSPPSSTAPLTLSSYVVTHNVVSTVSWTLLFTVCTVPASITCFTLKRPIYKLDIYATIS